VAGAALAWSGPCAAQGGPPLVTDDPDTVPVGHWEINAAAIGSRVPGFDETTAPNLDVNYGWGDHTQIKLEMPWLLAKADGAPVQSGLGALDFGIRWRFIDRERAGFEMSTYPQVLLNTLPSSYRRGLTQPGQTLFLPVEASGELAGFGLDGEIGRYISSSAAARAQQPDAWAAGLIVARGCPARLECLLEVRQTLAPHDAQTLLNIGGRRELSQALSLLFAAGHSFGPPRPDHQQLLLYLGLQIRI
jgi:hypothetical protein